jgi:cytosine deaminase
VTLLLRSARLADGSVVDVTVGVDSIEAVTPTTKTPPSAQPGDTDTVLDLSGYLLLPALAEPHAHLDKALTADQVLNATGDLAGAIEAWTAHRAGLTHDDVVDRSTRAALTLLRSGATAIRTHVDVASDIGLAGIGALAETRSRLEGRLDLQIVALVAPPLSGRAGADHRALLRDAMDVGADVVGGCPHIDPDPRACLEVCMAVAAEVGRPIDLHTDETLAPTVLDVRDFAQAVVRAGFPHGATASHCVSLGVQPIATQERVAAEIAEAGLSVVTLPQTNLFLQGRDHPVATPRGLTAIRALLQAGVTLAAGGDNLQDPFNLVGRGDPMETASLLVTAGHLSADGAFQAVGGASRQAMGLAPIEVAAGSPAELVAIRATTVREAIAAAPAERIVIHRGRVVARTIMEAS